MRFAQDRPPKLNSPPPPMNEPHRPPAVPYNYPTVSYNTQNYYTRPSITEQPPPL